MSESVASQHKLDTRLAMIAVTVRYRSGLHCWKRFTGIQQQVLAAICLKVTLALLSLDGISIILANLL